MKQAYAVTRVLWLTALLSALAAAGTVTYTYDELGRLKTVDQNGQFTQYTLDPAGNRVSVSSADTAAPSVPTSVSATAVAHNQVNLSWAASTDTGGSGVAGYKIYRNGNYLTSTAALTHSDTTVAASTTYSYRISAYDAATPTPNESAQSTAAGATTPAPPSPGTLKLSSSTYSVAESGGSVTITVTRTGGSAGAASVNYATSNGTATAGSDYTAKSGTLSWTNGDTANKTFSVPITNDGVVEGSETFSVTLSSASGASLGSPASATVTITEPAPGSLQLSSSSYSIAESGSSVAITVTRTGGSYGAVSVNYATSNGTATAGSDYTAKSGTLSWANGDTANKTFSVPITNDGVVEGSETFSVTLSSASGASLGSPASATVTITEAAPGSLKLSSSSYSIAENGGSVTITVTRTGGSYGAVSVNYATANGTATAGSDYTAKSGTLSWANGDAANKTFTVTILDDSTYEGNETFTVTLSGASGASLGSPASATVTITENDPPPDTTPPSAPTNLSTSAPSSTQVNLTWTASTDNVGVTGYRIERCAGASCSSFGQIGTSPTNSFSDNTTAGTTAYRYRVRATDAASNLSGYSNIASVTTPDTIAPSVPTGLSATAVSSSQINLSWNASTDTGGSGLAGYTVYRNGQPIWGPTSTSYSDTGLTPATSYSYTVTAWDNATNTSGHSTSASATTQSDPVPGSVSFTGASAACVGTLCYATSAGLTWNAASGTVTRYELEKSSDGLSWGTIYSGMNLYGGSALGEVEFAMFRVRACNNAGCSAYSSYASYFRPYGW